MNTINRWLACTTVLLATSFASAQSEQPQRRGWSARQQQSAIAVYQLDKPVLTYQLERPADSKLPVEGAVTSTPSRHRLAWS